MGNPNYNQYPIPPRQEEPTVADKDTEALVLGFMLSVRSVSVASAWLARLDEECFYFKQHIEIFRSMCELISLEAPQSPDMVNVWLQLRSAHPDSNVTEYDLAVMAQNRLDDPSLAIDMLRDVKVRRSMQRLALRILRDVPQLSCSMSDLIEEAQRVLDCQDVSHRHRGRALHDVLDELRQRVNENQDDAVRHHGPWTGIERLDAAGGLPEAGLVVLAGGTSQGKSSLGTLISLRSAEHGLRSAYFSLEMSDLSLASRMVSMTGQSLPAQGIKNWRLSDNSWQTALDDISLTDRLYGSAIYYDDSRSTRLDDICAGIRYMHHTQGIRLVVVDFLQLLNYTETSRTNITTEQMMGQAARTLKNLGDRLGICVVVLCQINRSLERQRPTLGIIRDSGQIAEAADMAIFAWRPEAYGGSYDQDLARYSTEGTMAFMVLKNREGPLMECLLRWDGEHTLASSIPSEQLGDYLICGEGRKERSLFE